MSNFQIEILVEEPSMDSFLRGVLPSFLPKEVAIDTNCFIRFHEGKSHLQKEIPKKVRAYQNYSIPVKVIVIQDQDSNDCLALKEKLARLIKDNSTLPHLIRIACRELEAWYLGDMQALEKVYPNFKAEKYCSKAKFRNPDLCNASDELKKLIPDFQKSHAARELPKAMQFDNNKSHSFHHLTEGIKRFTSTT